MILSNFQKIPREDWSKAKEERVSKRSNKLLEEMADPKKREEWKRKKERIKATQAKTKQRINSKPLSDLASLPRKTEPTSVKSTQTSTSVKATPTSSSKFDEDLKWIKNRNSRNKPANKIIKRAAIGGGLVLGAGAVGLGIHNIRKRKTRSDKGKRRRFYRS